jgi:hypothetical protein
MVVVYDLMRFLRAGHLFGLPRWQFLRRLLSVEPCGGFGGPYTRETSVLRSGLLVHAHARVASDSVFFTLSSFQCRCSTTAALSPARRWPFGAVVSAPHGFDTRMSAVCGWSCSFALVFSVVVCVQCPAVLMSQSNRLVSIM